MGQHEVRRKVNANREEHHQQQQIERRAQPALLFRARPKYPVDVLHGFAQKITSEQDQPGQQGLEQEGTVIVTQPPNQLNEQERQDQVEQGQATHEARNLGVEHVGAQANHLDAENQVDQEVSQPDHFQKADGKNLRAGQERILQPQGDRHEQQGLVGEPEKIGRPVIPPVNGNQDGNEQRAQQLKRKGMCGPEMKTGSATLHLQRF